MLQTNKPLVINSKYFIFLAMLYTTVTLAADVVAFRFESVFGLVASGATIIFPLTYMLGHVSCEVYGWEDTVKLVWLGLFCELIFAGLITVIIYMPSYGIGEHQDQYVTVLGNMWLFVIGRVISNAVAGLLNIYCMSTWKILTQGKYFWLRSILATCLSGFMLILLTDIIAFLPFITLGATMKILVHANVLEIIYALLFVLPAKYVVDFLRNEEKIDVYDYGVSYNPFKIFQTEYNLDTPKKRI